MKYISKKEFSIKKINFFKRINTFINNKIYLIKEEVVSRKILNNVRGYKLDKAQKKAVLMDEDTLLVVAGAGSGKTLTMLGKIKYLIEIKKINPSKILVLSFTNFTTNSFKECINKNIKSDIDVLTFHKLGIKILKMAKYNFKLCKNNLLKNMIVNYLKNDLLKDRKSLYNFIHYYLIYNTKLIFEGNYNMCEEEIVISNFLYCNGINYIYKPIEINEDKTIFAFYLYEYDIYIRHIIWKDFFDDRHYGSNFIVTNSYMFTYEDIFMYLYEEFKRKNIIVDKSKYLELCNIFLSKGNKIENLINLIITFINILKSNDYSVDKFKLIRKIVNKISNKLEKNKYLFTLSIIEKIYVKYESYLRLNSEIDFNDIINISSNLVKEGKALLNYSYIIVDEFQDTSYARYELIKNIKDKCCAKLLAVGDDFQSIYRFTGCDIKMFLNFEKIFKFSKIIYITNTYRNSNELINVAGKFIMKNKYQMKKNLRSIKYLRKPVKIYFYKDKSEINILFQKIKENNILVLGRNNKDVSYLDCLHSSKKIKFMSVHKSKGLESDGVVIVNLEDNIMGFPSKIPADKLINYLCDTKDLFPYEEERRLFYVALTRTRNNVYLFVPLLNPSIFVKEIVNNYKKYIEIIN